MRRLAPPFVFLVLMAPPLHAAGATHPLPPTLALGSAAPDFDLPGVDGQRHHLADFADARVLAVIFSCNHCPTAQAYEGRIKALAADYPKKDVAVVVISPNSPDALALSEEGYSDLGDSLEDMKIRARDAAFDFPYLYDGDTQSVAKAYGPVSTPHAFVFDAQRNLRYVGRIDGSEKPGTGHGEDIRRAIDELLAGKPVSVPQTKTFGCSVKWSWKNEWTQRLDREWEAAPVSLDVVDTAALAAARRNEGGGKLRLINTWATWCGPCVSEFPELVKITRIYKDRPFEFVSISFDEPDQQAAVEERLKGWHAASPPIRNLLINSSDPYPFIEALDPEWSGGLPYTILVEPGGKVVYRSQGPFDPLELRRAIVENPLLGRTYR
jgi:thiol-disulfide isomerase/thioredoxin